MVSLADVDDLAAVMARDLSASDTDRAPLLLDIASQRVRTYAGQTFTHETTTDRLPVRSGRVRLPQRPVLDVTAVTDTAEVAVTYDWDGRNVLCLSTTELNWFEVEPRRTRLATVLVTYEHGYEDVPADIVGIVCDMVAAALDSPPEQVGVQSESLGPYSVTHGSQMPGGVRLTQSMKDALLPYMAPVGTATVR